MVSPQLTCKINADESSDCCLCVRLLLAFAFSGTRSLRSRLIASTPFLSTNGRFLRMPPKNKGMGITEEWGGGGQGLDSEQNRTTTELARIQVFRRGGLMKGGTPVEGPGAFSPVIN